MYAMQLWWDYIVVAVCAFCCAAAQVVNLARVSPVSSSALQLPISSATILGVNVTGGCGKAGSGTS
jgi:hypothetical protein